MNNLFNDDFPDFILAFNKANVDYILVGGFSVVIHGYNRATGDTPALPDGQGYLGKKIPYKASVNLVCTPTHLITTYRYLFQ